MLGYDPEVLFLVSLDIHLLDIKKQCVTRKIANCTDSSATKR